MILLDNKTDSLLIYCDWLEDNEQLELSIEIRQELQELHTNLWEICYYYHPVGSLCSELHMSSGNLVTGTGDNCVGALFYNTVANENFYLGGVAE